MSDLETENTDLELDFYTFMALSSPFQIYTYIMPIIEYDLYEMPHAAKGSAESFYPVVVERNKVNENDICEYAEKSTTLNAADIKATFSMFAQYVFEHLANGDRVELPGIGSLILRIGSDEPITDCDDKQLARNLKVRSIGFTPKRDLIRAIAKDAHFHRAKSLHKTIPALTDEELVSRLQAFVRLGNEPMFTRAIIQNVIGYTKARTIKSLKDWIERGILIKFGSPRSPYYRLAPEFAEEQQADDPEAQQ